MDSTLQVQCDVARAAGACEAQLKLASVRLAGGDQDGAMTALDAAANWSARAFRTLERAAHPVPPEHAPLDFGGAIARRTGAGVITVTAALPLRLRLTDVAARDLIQQLELALAIESVEAGA